MSEEYNKLFEYFKTFPGIGKRQAERFVYHILTKENSWVDNLANELRKSKQGVFECSDCCRVFRNKPNENFHLCDVCRSQNRDRSILAVVERNIDAEVMLKKASWPGLVFVLGGQYQVIEKKNPPRVHLEELLRFIKKNSFQEIILCDSLNQDGIFTAQIISQKIRELAEDNNMKIRVTTLGRGFSTGTELEYVDKETLQNALANRTEKI
jgi:recombination protein RecR